MAVGSSGILQLLPSLQEPEGHQKRYIVAWLHNSAREVGGLSREKAFAYTSTDEKRTKYNNLWEV